MHMTETKEDLWPDNLATPPQDKPPLLILREQASLLGQKTGNLVDAEVTTSPEPDGGLALRFTLVAPALSGYRYVLFTAVQSAMLYPVALRFDGLTYHAHDEAGLKQYLRNFFASEPARRVISGLVVQSQSESA